MIDRDSNCMSNGYYRFCCAQTSFETLIERGEIGVFVVGSVCFSWNSQPVQGHKHFCQPAAVEVGGCQETKAGIRWRLLCQNKNRPLVLSSLFVCCQVVYESLRERRPSTLQWHLESKAFSLGYSRQSSRTPTRASYTSRMRGIFPGILPAIFLAITPSFVPCSLRYDVLAVSFLLQCVVYRKRD